MLVVFMKRYLREMMNNNVKLISVVGDKNLHILLPHFVEHYLGLGINKENFYLTLTRMK